MRSWFNNLKIRSKLILIFLLLISLSIVMGVVALVSQGYTQEAVHQVIDVAGRKNDLAFEIESAMLQAHRAEQEYLLNYRELGFQEAHSTYISHVQAQVATIHTKLATLKSLESQQSNQAQIDELDAAVTKYERLFLDTVDLIEQRGYLDKGVEGRLREKIHTVEDAIDAAMLAQLRIDILSIRRREKDYLLRGEEQYITQLHEGVATLKRDLAASTLDASEKRQLDVLVDGYRADFDELVNIDQAIAANIDIYRAEGLKLEPILEQIRRREQQEVDATQASLAETYRITALMVVIGGVLVVVVGLLLAFFLSRILAGSVQVVARAARGIAEGDLDQQVEVSSQDEFGEMMGSFQRMISYLQAMARAADQLAQGDLSAEIEPQSAHDTLGNAFALMIVNLRELVSRVHEDAESVTSATQQMAEAAQQVGLATSQVSATIQQVARGAAQQTESVTSTTSSVEQMARAIDSIAKGAQEQAAAVSTSASITTQLSTTISQVNSNAQSGARGAAQAAETARNGARTIVATIRGIESINDRVSLSAQKVKEMGQRSEEIGTIIETIDDIASQTDLLALNAAIEAARAGEYGKGFAVVADEVRKLAEKSAGATKEITVLIKSIQRTVTEAVETMQESAGEVKVGVERANQAGQALEQIVVATEGASRQMEEVAVAAQEMNTLAGKLVGSMDMVSAVVEENTAATEEMAAGSGEVTQALENIASITEENSASAEEVAASVEEVNSQMDEVAASAQSLNELALELQSVVARFKLPGAAAPAIRQPVFKKNGKNGHAPLAKLSGFAKRSVY